MDTTKRDYTIHPYRLSDSALHTLLLCERRFQLDRLLENAQVGSASRSSPETVRGSAYGVGVQSYLLYGDMERAIWECWLAYSPMLENPPKTFMTRTINNLAQSRPVLDKLRSEYAVAFFNYKPAIELSFRLNLDDRWYYVGYIDAVLQHKKTGAYGVFECKTTSAWYKDLAPLYRYSGQALGYSIILDQIAGSEVTSFLTPYLVCRDVQPLNFVPDVQILPFSWTLLDRLKWFLAISMDVQRLNMMDEHNLFPQRQQGCMSYGKVCPHFGFCQLTATDKKRAVTEDKNAYQFTYNLHEVIEDHVRRIA